MMIAELARSSPFLRSTNGEVAPRSGDGGVLAAANSPPSATAWLPPPLLHFVKMERILVECVTMDDTASLLSLADRMLWVTALVAAPVLLASLAIGLVVGIVQAATSVNEQTLTFVPKLVAIALVLVLFGASMLGLISDFMQEIFVQIAGISR